MRLYAFLRACARVLLRFLFRFRAVGVDKIPDEGGFILAVNHMSFWDAIFLAASVPNRHLTFMARSSLFTKPLVGWCLRTVGAVSVDRDANDFSALRTALALLKDGHVIGIYPQGTRCPDAPPSESHFESGAAYMAMTAKVPIFPIGVATKNYRVRWFRKVRLHCGNPLFFERDRDRTAIERNTQILKERISALAEEALADLGSGART